MAVNTNITYKYDNLKNDINRLTHMYQFYNDKNVLFCTINLDNHDFSTSDLEKNILIVKDNFCLLLQRLKQLSKHVIKENIAGAFG